MVYLLAACQAFAVLVSCHRRGVDNEMSDGIREDKITDSWGNGLAELFCNP